MEGSSFVKNTTINKTFLTLIVLCFYTFSFSQTNSFVGIDISIESNKILSKTFKSYSVFQIDATALNDYVKGHPAPVSINLFLGDNHHWSLQITPDDIRSSHYNTVKTSQRGNQTLPHSENKTFKGAVLNQNGGALRLTLDEGFIYGYFEIGNDLYFIEPLWTLMPEAQKDWFIVYKTSDVKPQNDLKCGWERTGDLLKTIQKDKAPRTEGEKVLGNCYTVEIAIASDFRMFQTFGSVGAVENFTIGNLNNVQTNYDNEFADEIRYEIVTQFVSNCSTCDPWTSSTNANALLDDFALWGNNGNFGVNYDVASLWTDRNLNGGTIGLAWISGLCSTSNKYNLLEHYSSGNANTFRVLQSHELGHNFSALHDSGSSTIMATSVNSSTTWSSASVNSIDAFIVERANSGGCFSNCAAPAPPVASIIAPITHVCPGSVVPFIDNSANSPTSWSWQMNGANPNSSSEQNPVVTYNNEGIFSVSLNVSNSQGNDFTSLSPNIQVDQNGIKYLLYETFEGPPIFWQINNPDGNITWSWVSVGGTLYGNHAMMVNNFNYDNPGQVDGLISQPISFVGETGITLEIDYAYRRFNAGNSDIMRVLVSIDGGNTFPFTIFTGQENGSGNFATADDSQSQFTPNSQNDWCFGSDFGADCLSLNLNQFTGEANVQIKIENETGFGNNLFVDNIRVSSSCIVIQPPISAFSANNTDGCAPLSVNFSDQSIGAIDTWFWEFPGGLPTTSTQTNPVVVYNNPGDYAVSLTVYNAAGQSTSSDNQYIHVNTAPIANFQYTITDFQVLFDNFSQNGTTYLWDFGDGQTDTNHSPSHTYLSEGEYTVSLTVTNECGSNTFEETFTIASPLSANFSTDTNTGCAPLTVNFSDNSTGDITNWAWTFENGTPATSTEQNPTIEYTTPGTFTVTLVVSNDFSENTIEQVDIITIDDIPNANFTAANPLGSTNVDFTDSSSDTDLYEWDFGDGESSDLQNPSHEYLTEGDFTVTLTAINDCGNDIFTQTITIILPPQASFSASVTQGCLPMEVQFDASPIGDTYTYEWSFEGANPATSTDANPLINYTTLGQFNVELTVTNAAGSDVSTMQNFIIVDDIPSANFSVNNPVGSTNVDFTDSSIDADTYQWDFGDGESSSEQNPSHEYQTEGDFTVTLTVTNDCGEDIFTQDITIILPPQASFSASVTQGCLPMDVQFNANPTGDAYTYEWTFEGGTPTTSIDANPLVNYTAAGQFDVELTVTNVAGSDVSTMQNFIIIDDIPNANFSANNPIGSATVDFTNNSSGANTYAWDFGDGESSNEQNPSHEYQTEGDFTVTLTVSNDCGTDVFTQDISIILPPQANFSASATQGCLPMEVLFSASPVGEEYTYEWIFEGGTPATSTDANPTVNYTQAGQFDVQLTVTNAVGNDVSTMQNLINIDDIPNANFSANNPTGNSNVDFTNNSIGANTYAWDFGDEESSNEQNPSHEYQNEGNFTITLTTFNSCGSDIFMQNITIILPPQASFSASNTQGCLPMEVQFDASPTGDAYTYEWTFEGGNPATSTSANPTVNYTQAGQFDVQLTVTNAAGSDVSTMQNFINIDDTPSANFSADNPVGSTVIDFTDNSMEANTYTWDFGDGESSNEQNPSHEYQTEGNFTVTLTAFNDCGSDIFTQEVSIILPPQANFTASNTQGCLPMEVQFDANPTGDAYTYEWTFEGGTPATSSASNPAITYSQTGQFDVELTVTNAAGSDIAIMQNFIIIDDVPSVDFSAESNGFTVQFFNSTSNADNFLWDFGDDNTSAEENPVHTYAAGGEYTVSLTASNDCGSITTTQTVVINVNFPMIHFSAMNNEGCEPLSVQFMHTSENTDSISWTFPGGIPAQSSEQNPIVVYDNAGIYNVTLVGYNVFGSSAMTQTELVIVEANPTAGYDFEQNESQVNFSNTSENANVFVWNFGDNQSSTDENPSHTYETGGVYEIQLIAENDCGFDTITQVISILVDGLLETTEISDIKIFPNPNKGTFTLEINGLSKPLLKISVLDIIGQRIFEEEHPFITGHLNKSFNYSSLPDGLYIIQVQSGEQSIYKKLIINK